MLVKPPRQPPMNTTAPFGGMRRAQSGTWGVSAGAMQSVSPSPHIENRPTARPGGQPIRLEGLPACPRSPRAM